MRIAKNRPTHEQLHVALDAMLEGVRDAKDRTAYLLGALENATGLDSSARMDLERIVHTDGDAKVREPQRWFNSMLRDVLQG